MSTRSRSLNKIFGLKVRIPKIKRQKGNNDGSKKTKHISTDLFLAEPEAIVNQDDKEQLYSITPITIFNLPTEIYLQILSYLLIGDLFTLSCVSKFFRELLWSKSEFTQSIWKTCRSLYYPKYPTLPPPDGMCEQQYAWITLAKKTCQFCEKPYENSGFTKWTNVNINCCDPCMSLDTYIMEENSLNKQIPFPFELRGCIPYTEYVGYFGENFHKYYFIEDVKKIKSEYDSLEEEEKGSWVENKRKELRDHLEKIENYQRQDVEYYWSQFQVPQREIDEIEDDDDELDDEEEEGEDQVYTYDRGGFGSYSYDPSILSYYVNYDDVNDDDVDDDDVDDDDDDVDDDDDDDVFDDDDIDDDDDDETF